MSGIEDDLGDVWPKKLYPHGGGREWSTSTHGDTWKESAGFEVVPADGLRRAVEALREIVRHADTPAGESWERSYREVTWIAQVALADVSTTPLG